MTFNEVLSQTITMLHQHGRVSYRALKRQFGLDDDYLADLTEALLFAHPQAVAEGRRGLVWRGAPDPAPPTASPLTALPLQAPSPTRPRIWRKKSWPPAVPWKASASRSPSCLPTSKAPPS